VDSCNAGVSRQPNRKMERRMSRKCFFIFKNKNPKGLEAP
jgi:hypothetical protein